jgi:hypothetical protein
MCNKPEVLTYDWIKSGQVILVNAIIEEVGFRTDFTGKRGGLNGWTQHSTRTQFAVKTKAKTAR